jgi:hypothetical protein
MWDIKKGGASSQDDNNLARLLLRICGASKKGEYHPRMITTYYQHIPGNLGMVYFFEQQIW